MATSLFTAALFRTTIKASGTLEHQPPVWSESCACAQPWTAVSALLVLISMAPTCGLASTLRMRLVRPHRQGIAVGQKIELKALYCLGDMAVRMRGLVFECVTCFHRNNTQTAVTNMTKKQRML